MTKHQIIFFGLDTILCQKLTKIFSHLNVKIHTPFESPMSNLVDYCCFKKIYTVQLS
jgi:hypothetical protein